MNALCHQQETDIGRLVRIVQRTFKTEIAFISLIDEEHARYVSCDGSSRLEMFHDHPVAAHIPWQENLFVVTDSTRDARFRDAPLMTAMPKIRFYAGQPLCNGEGLLIGTLCLLSSEPRGLSEDEAETLSDLACMIEGALENNGTLAAVL
jgi:GAF domain-containing protein